MSQDEEWSGQIETHVGGDPDFYVGLDVTVAQYLRTGDGVTGHGFAFLVLTYEDPDSNMPTGQKQISIAMADTDFYPTFLRDLFSQIPCEELADELMHVLDNHKHEDKD